MENLTSKQIADFNNPLAFARDRSVRVGAAALRSETSTIRTKSMEESYRLVLGAAERLETLRGNLNTMLDLAQKGSRAGGNERKAAEYYGKIRSLTAGFDQIVEAIRFDKKPIFTNRPIELSMDIGRDLKLDPVRLLTYGENSLNLSQSVPSAKASVDYFVDDQIVNDAYDIIGLDISGASFHGGGIPGLELESGVYKVNVEYMGENSSVSIRSREGELIERKEGVDLSGSGTQWVDFDRGVRLNFEMESLFQTFDKYDFESRGPANLSATLSYERIDRQLVRTAENPIVASEAEFALEYPLTVGETSLRVSDAEVAPVAPGKQALKSGNYNLEIEYYGADSVVRLRDSFGRISAYKFGVDLSQQGPQKIDFENGLRFQFENNAFTSVGAQYFTSLKYTTEPEGPEDFDFRAYQKTIREAIAVIEDQQRIIAETQATIEQTNQLRNQASTGGFPSSGVLNASTTLSLISGGGGIGIFANTSPEARFGILSEQLFQTTTALPSQANQSPEALARLSAGGNTASLLSTFA